MVVVTEAVYIVVGLVGSVTVKIQTNARLRFGLVDRRLLTFVPPQMLFEPPSLKIVNDCRIYDHLGVQGRMFGKQTGHSPTRH